MTNDLNSIKFRWWSPVGPTSNRTERNVPNLNGADLKLGPTRDRPEFVVLQGAGLGPGGDSIRTRASYLEQGASSALFLWASMFKKILAVNLQYHHPSSWCGCKRQVPSSDHRSRPSYSPFRLVARLLGFFSSYLPKTNKRQIQMQVINIINPSFPGEDHVISSPN